MSRFQQGQIVCLKADPRRAGPVLEVLGPGSAAIRYRVFHAPDDVPEYYEEQLSPLELPAAQDKLRSALLDGKTVTPETFADRITAARLAHPLTDNLYALKAARIQFIPFQFKPLLRLLASDRPRLLIADEVGVGKTIEAGLILRELSSRQKLENVLIVCPKALVYKWQQEMRRFDEGFRILDGDRLKYCLNEVKNEGEWPLEYPRAIVHLELLRREQYLSGGGRHPGLQELDPPPRFDLLIVDEAHHTRNPTTLSNEVVRFLCDTSEAVIFLSATPVHLGSTNLFSLVNLLRGDLFPSEDVFQEMMEPTKHLLAAARKLRARELGVAECLDAASNTSWGARVLNGAPHLRSWRSKVEGELSDGDRVRCLRDLEELQPLAGVVTRTRRRDIGRFTIRQPVTLSVDFTPLQRVFYDQLLSFRTRWLATRYDPLVVRLIIDNLQRQAASCLPALLPTLDLFLKTGRFAPTRLTDIDEDEEDGEGVNLPPEMLPEAAELRALAAALPSEDPKYDQLQLLIQQTKSQPGPGKVLIFSFFLHTLHYLLERLKRANVRVAMISGATEDLQREALRDRFRLPSENEDALDVLLSSEVGCEGLDYQFCDRLVNYDIPWNPMRIEQRIGRIDRFGQRSEKVLIFNFITPGTVEERIFFRCFERLGIFSETVGDLEGVLGDLTQDLARISLDPTLTPDQAEHQAQQIADNILRRMDEEKRLEEQSPDLLWNESRFNAELEAIEEEGKAVTPEALADLVSHYLAQDLVGATLVSGRQPHTLTLKLTKTARALLLERLESLEPNRSVKEFVAQVESPKDIPLTFDQQVAVEDRIIPFITPLHPLARLAVRYWDSRSEPLVTAMQIDSGSLPSGTYSFICEIWQSIGVRHELRLVTSVVDIATRQPVEALERVFLANLGQARPAARTHDGLDAALDASQLCLAERRRLAQAELAEKNQTLLERQLASLNAYYQVRLERVSEELQRVSEERIQRMKRAEQRRLESQREARKQDLLSRQEVDILTTRLAAGILEVGSRRQA